MSNEEVIIKVRKWLKEGHFNNGKLKEVLGAKNESTVSKKLNGHIDFTLNDIRFLKSEGVL